MRHGNGSHGKYDTASTHATSTSLMGIAIRMCGREGTVESEVFCIGILVV
jgi:hypothetical protein